MKEKHTKQTQPGLPLDPQSAPSTPEATNIENPDESRDVFRSSKRRPAARPRRRPTSKKTTLPEKIKLLRDFYHAERRLPGYEEMLYLFNFKSKNAVHSLLLKLNQMDYITKSGRKIAPTGKLTGKIRLLGTIQAGFPSPAEEELVDTMSLDEYLIDNPNATFMLKVTGDSMIDAGIHPDDIVLVERGKTPRPGDIVIAQVDDDWTMKYYSKDKDGVFLVPANVNFKPIRPQHSLELAGVVCSVIRKYA
jgi:SOS regulatory protein LexA